MNETIRTRFSPSPTGLIHLGNARAALFAALMAAQKKGIFILRIEDTDAVRSKEEYVKTLKEDLLWFGIDWQEGPDADGPYGPYWQSQRQNIYAEFYKILEDKKLIYPCFCSDETLMRNRKISLSQGQAPRYSRKCRNLPAKEIEEKISRGEQAAWRFKVPSKQTISFNDFVKGTQNFQSDDIGDFIVRRKDSTAPFLFCNAIDDALMKVTHVMRGEDHVANTPRQIMILNALQLPIPKYGHLSLILGDDGAPLAKRHGSYSLHDMKKQGYLAAALMNYLARLGHTYQSQDLLNFNELAHQFDAGTLSQSPARFDLSQLKYWQKISVLKLMPREFWMWLGEDIQNRIPMDKQVLFESIIKKNILFPSDASDWSHILYQKNMMINDEEKKWITEANDVFFIEAEKSFKEHKPNLKNLLNDLKAKLGISGKKLFMPLRVALTGKTDGPELAQLFELLGEDMIQYRFKKAIEIASEKN